jgi:hypothetical protein
MGKLKIPTTVVTATTSHHHHNRKPRKPSPRRIQAIVKAATNGAIEAAQARLGNGGGFRRASITVDLDGCRTQIVVESGQPDGAAAGSQNDLDQELAEFEAHHGGED